MTADPGSYTIVRQGRGYDSPRTLFVESRLRDSYGGSC